MKYLIAIFASLMFTFSAHAETSVWVTGGGFSKHFKNSEKYNESNGGVGLEVHTSDQLAFIAGTFTNSEYDRSEYAAVAWQPLSYGPLKFGAVGGVMNGYANNRNGGVFPVILPMVSFEYKRVGMNMMIAPNLRGPGAFMFQFKFKLN